MARPRIAMTAAEVADFLAAKHMVVVGTRAPDGGPDGEPAALAYRDGAVCFTVARDGPTHRNLLADPRAVCSVDEFPSYAEIRGVGVHGRAIPVAETADSITFRLEAVRTESFDFRKMRPRTE
jgi:nitroimidazol reductase NimA-like FMN-containing flavoprotein (pyridoxamine 5'-phosphate oxidase superfamily)